MLPHPAHAAEGTEVALLILVVEDDPVQRLVVGAFLTQAGYQVALAAEGGEALKILDEQQPALILLDMVMPGMDGWHFARELKDRQIEIPILVMTAAENAREWSEEIGAAGYMTKPLSLPLLEMRIRTVVG
jgi:two-component system response regulator MprA